MPESEFLLFLIRTIDNTMPTNTKTVITERKIIVPIYLESPCNFNLNYKKQVHFIKVDNFYKKIISLILFLSAVSSPFCKSDLPC